jgi:hypothetical protein
MVGDHTRLSVRKNKFGQNRWESGVNVVEFVQVLARHMSDKAIASILNRLGESTVRGNSWTSSRVYSLRHNHGIAPYRQGERAERGEVTIEEAAAALSVSLTHAPRRGPPGPATLQGCTLDHPFADLECKGVRDEAKRQSSRRPSSRDPRQKSLDFKGDDLNG